MATRQIKRMTPNAEAIMDWLLVHPGGRYKECACELEVSENWISIVVNSAVFQVEYERRRRTIQERIDEKLQELADKALDCVSEALEGNEDRWFALRVFDRVMHHYSRQVKDRKDVTIRQGVCEERFTVRREDLERARERLLREQPPRLE